MIRIYCRAADAILKETQTLTSGMTNYPEVVMTYSSDWDGFGKAVVVRAGTADPVSVLVTDNKFIIPAECLDTHGVNLIVGVSGSNGDQTIPTIWCSVGEIYEGTDIDEAPNVGTATPTLVEQMLGYAGACQVAAEAAADDAQDAADDAADAAASAAEAAESAATAHEDAEAWAKGTRNGVPVAEGEDGYHDNAKYYKELSDADSDNADAKALVSEGYALGTQGGTPVTPGSDYYENNAKYMKEQAAVYTLQADGFSGESAAWATGSYSGGDTPVPSTAPQHNNNAKYYSGQASTSATNAYNSATDASGSASAASGSASSASMQALKSEGFAVGKQNGTDVGEGSPYYHNNAKYYAELTSETIVEAVDDWLDNHPEATTTVQDSSLTEAKFTDELKLKTIKDYVTPEMFGAKGDGEANDYAAFRACADYAYANKKPILLPSKKYAVTGDNPLGVPYSFTETDYDRLTYCMNIDGGDSVIEWTPEEDTDRFINGQHLRYSTIQNLKVRVSGNTPKGRFLSTETNDGLSHTFSQNKFINCAGENLLYAFNFDSTGANPTHDDLCTFIGVSMNANVFYYTTNGNSVNHNFINCSWMDSSTGGSFIYINVANWAGGINCYGCHFTTQDDDIVIRTILANKRKIALYGCRLELYGDDVELINTISGSITVDNLETIVLSDSINHAFIVAKSTSEISNANIIVRDSIIPSDLVIVQNSSKIKFFNCLFATGRTLNALKSGVSIDRTNSGTAKRDALYFETAESYNNSTFIGVFRNDYLLKETLSLCDMNPAGTQRIVNRNATYYSPYNIVADFTYIHEDPIGQANPEFAVLVNNVQKAKVGIDATATGISIKKGDAVTFKFYKNNDPTDIAEAALGVTSSFMKVEYICE